MAMKVLIVEDEIMAQKPRQDTSGHSGNLIRYYQKVQTKMSGLQLFTAFLV